MLAYDQVASNFEALSDRRRAYLASVERLVSCHIPSGSRSLLDVGAGNGMRAMRIAQDAGIESLLLLEPSARMRLHWPAGVHQWPLRAEELSAKSGSFEVILCLWNVLGHIFPPPSRVEVLCHCARLLAPGGKLFVDVNNRYNAAQYGVLRTLLRMLRDRARPHVENGDVAVRWHISGETYTTRGHVFTPGEFSHIAQSAGLIIEKQFIVHYSTGRLCRCRFAGNPVYILRRS